MAKFYEYENNDVGYIRTLVDESPYVLQLAPSAERLLKRLGYTHAEYVPVDLTKPLLIVGVLKTDQYGSSRRELLDDLSTLSPGLCELNADQQAELRAYLDDRIDDLTLADYGLLNTFLENESPLAPISDYKFVTDSTGGPKETQTTDSEAAHSIDVYRIPTALKELNQWICWRYEHRNNKKTKVPISPHEDGFASVNNPTTWGDFHVATEALQRADVDGIGFVFTSDDTIAGIDLDGVRDPETGSLTQTAEAIVSTVDSYTEVSPSDTGLHILLKGFVPEGRQRHDGIELYDTGRFFTVTGEQLEDSPSEIAVRHHELEEVHRNHVAREASEDSSSQSRSKTASSTGISNKTDPPSGRGLPTDQVLEHAKQNDKFRRLWGGNTAGYPSQSEADMALCCLLAYYTGDNLSQMDSLFRQSGLMRDKWNEQRGDQTYGELTLQKAVQFVDEYDPHLHADSTSSSVDEISRLETEQTATIEATVETVDEIPTEEIDQAGQLTDGTGSIRFVVWNSDYWGLDWKFAEGESYRLENVWVTEYNESPEVHINEHTTVK